jgi:Methyltransferase domain
VLQAAEELDLEPHLKLHVVDAWKLEPSFEADAQLDFLWIDFGAGRKLAEFLQQWWHRVPAGGIVALHSTVTNSYTREWLEEMRAGMDINYTTLFQACVERDPKIVKASTEL